MTQNLELAQVIRDCPALQEGTGWRRITKGYSGDRLYTGVLEGERTLLRIFDAAGYASKRQEYEMLGQLAALGVRCSRPLQFGLLEEQGVGYMLLTYIAGEDASVALPQLPVETQYAIGLEAGRELRKLHQLAAPPDWPGWYEAKAAKHRRYAQAYRICGVQFPGDEAVLAFIDRHLEAMRGRPNLFQHDDYHPSNLIVEGGRFAGVIDIGRFDWGDPVHEFLKIGMFTIETSLPFAVGQIRGYHEGREPDESFWQLYALYMAMSVISSVVWVVKHHPQELEEMMTRLNRVMDDHQGFELHRPIWYPSLG
ncbi:aminoglycoside phosphotransferase family protein [Paenibacillus sp. 1P07SE]|uniref:aminoglycoside phosphotransferase family protein n=1 Tax=Paenibacillus sp. 1P07SE TaxID=3132209 RepID=UPI0039A7204B